DPEGRSANATPAEALTPEEAVRLYTTNAAAVLGEAALGRLEPGSPADLIEVRAPTLDAAIHLGSSALRGTWVEGVRVAVGPGRPDQQTV
ncbi:MAG: amidohydrolase family protein, partial [Thermoplasmata archaeon]